MFRDVVMGRRTDENLVTLLDRIRNAVESERAICPISQDSFAEIFMQSDLDTLSATIQQWINCQEPYAFPTSPLELMPNYGIS
jgi:hypothetical protein